MHQHYKLQFKDPALNAEFEREYNESLNKKAFLSGVHAMFSEQWPEGIDTPSIYFMPVSIH